MTSSDLLFRTLKKLYQFSILAQNHVKTNRCRKNWSLTCCRRLRDVPDLQVTRLPLQSPQKVPQWRPASVPKLFPTWFASPGLRNPFWTRSLLSFWVILGWFKKLNDVIFLVLSTGAREELGWPRVWCLNVWSNRSWWCLQKADVWGWSFQEERGEAVSLS